MAQSCQPRLYAASTSFLTVSDSRTSCSSARMSAICLFLSASVASSPRMWIRCFCFANAYSVSTRFPLSSFVGIRKPPPLLWSGGDCQCPLGLVLLRFICYLHENHIPRSHGKGTNHSAHCLAYIGGL